MRLLDRAHIEYETREYPELGDDDYGVRVAEYLGIDPERCFKTLVVTGSETRVLMIPVNRELDLKKTALACSEKSVSMLALRDLRDVTGYVRGGVSPIALKKPYPVYIDASAAAFETIAFSAGARGLQIVASPLSLAAFLGADFVDVCVR
jgi:Cys-tRNA(Pro)/Cys-tRNA(Cys) deacylase